MPLDTAAPQRRVWALPISVFYDQLRSQSAGTSGPLGASEHVQADTLAQLFRDTLTLMESKEERGAQWVLLLFTVPFNIKICSIHAENRGLDDTHHPLSAWDGSGCEMNE